jgi:hypothetical protein
LKSTWQAYGKEIIFIITSLVLIIPIETSAQKTSPNKHRRKDANLSIQLGSPDSSALDFMHKIGTSSFISNSEIFDYTPSVKELNLSKDDQFNLMQSLQVKDKEIEILNEKLKDAGKSMKKSKRRGSKKSSKPDKHHQIIQETLDELDRLDSEDP